MRGQVSQKRATKRNTTKESFAGRGAVQSKTGFADLLLSYWAHHKSSAGDSFHRLIVTPAQTLMTSLVVAIALALPVTLLLVLDNLSRLGERWDSKPKISVYLNTGAKQVAIDQLISELESDPDINSIIYLSQEQALADFQAFSGFGKALEALEKNPLPPTLIVSPRLTSLEARHLEDLGRRIEKMPTVEEVTLDMDWIRRLQEMMLLGRQIVLVLASLLTLGVLLAIGNTIRLAIENRRDEILIIKLVGGTDGFVRRPFLYCGGWYGLFGGVLACALIIVGFAIVRPSVARLAFLYQSEFRLQGIGFGDSLQLLVMSAGLGWVGAWIAVGRHIRHIEPK